MESNSHEAGGGTKRRRTAGYNKVYFSWYYVKLGSLAELELFKKHSAAVVAVSSLNMHAAKRPNTPFWSSRECHPLHAIILPYPHTRCSPIKQLKCRLQRHSSSYSRLLLFFFLLYFFFFLLPLLLFFFRSFFHAAPSILFTRLRCDKTDLLQRLKLKLIFLSLFYLLFALDLSMMRNNITRYNIWTIF